MQALHTDVPMYSVPFTWHGRDTKAMAITQDAWLSFPCPIKSLSTPTCHLWHNLVGHNLSRFSV